MSRCVILSAGPVTNAKDLRGLLRENDLVIAADGGCRLAKMLGIDPAVVVADFDSSELLEVESSAEIIRLPVRKDSTDTAAAAEYAFSRGYREFLFLGCTGGRLDHQYAATQLLVHLAQSGCRAWMADDRNLITAVVKSPCVVEQMLGWSLSLFAFGDFVHGLTVRGAAYELTRYDLSPTDSLCVSNAVEDGPCEITFDDGTLLLYRSKD